MLNSIFILFIELLLDEMDATSGKISVWIYREPRGNVCSSHGACKKFVCQNPKPRGHEFSGWIYTLIREKVEG
jgi:hypothetical protein